MVDENSLTSTMFMSLSSDMEFVQAKLHYSYCAAQYQINTQARVKPDPL
ncbi:Putative uncharacterized protein [Moritella viscosa]|uniref:Uncharacterized protein n=1 Tax=Moritella viscosa TaxID=80854 RepID=A0ABY1H840_9GAMM|nr:Putative uncharacterized protein [Moritella viscosa]SGY86152.1 Putative uncharacterized protein [Moritella viscosa]SHO24546.1 Putative uncharacterized protein [Moritella viscosa]